MPVQTKSEAQRVLDQVTFAPSCLDMGWGWDIEHVYEIRDGKTEIKGWNIRTTFQRPDTDTGEVGTGYGRWWFVEQGTSVSGLVKTAWLACQQIVQHELMEAFLFQGVRVFDPHAEVHALIDLNRSRRAS